MAWYVHCDSLLGLMVLCSGDGWRWCVSWGDDGGLVCGSGGRVVGTGGRGLILFPHPHPSPHAQPPTPNTHNRIESTPRTAA